MSVDAFQQDTRRESCPQAVARVLVTQPGLLTGDYVRLVLGHSRPAIKAALHRLKAFGYVVNRRQAGIPGRGQWHAVRWEPTPELRRLAARGQMPVVGRTPRCAEMLEDDGWQPPTQYVSALRAQILGLKRAA